MGNPPSGYPIYATRLSCCFKSTCFVTLVTLSIHSVFTWKREAFYWATVLVTFALGTAAGDLTADSFAWGTLNSGLVFTAVILVPLIGSKWLRFNDIFAFWFAYIFTRPLGASYADWLSQSHDRGGLGLGSNWISLALTIAIAILVGVMASRRKGSGRALAEAAS